MKRFYKWLTPMKFFLLLVCFYVLCIMAGGIDPSRWF